MPAYTFMPYRYASSDKGADCLELSCKGVSLDGQPFSAGISDGSVDVSEAGPWTSMQLDLSVTLADDVEAGLARLDECLQASEAWSTELDLLVTARDSFGRSRTSVQLERAGGAESGAWRGALTFERRKVSGPINLTAFAVRRADSAVQGRGLAQLKGERIAGSAQLTVHLVDRPSMPGGLFNGEWRDFSDEASGLKPYESCTSFLDLSDPDRPRLLLNECIDGLKQALKSEARRGAPARVRDQLIDSIVSPVIQTLAVAALTKAASDEEESELDGWRKGVLECLAQQSSTGTAGPLIRRWVELWRSGDVPEVLTEMAPLIQLHLDSGRSATWLVKEAGGRLNNNDHDA